MDYRAARISVRITAVAAFLYAAWIYVDFGDALYLVTDGVLFEPGDHLTLVGSSVPVVCGIAILRFSRIASVVLFCFVLMMIASGIGFGMGPVIWSSLVFAVFTLIGLLGAFRYHRLRRQGDSTCGRPSRWWYVAGAVTGIAFSLVLALAVIAEMDWVPSSSVTRGFDMSGEDKYWLVRNGIVGRDELIRLYYFSPIEVNGNILTDKRVISYVLYEDGLETFEAEFHQISKLEIIQQGGFFTETVIEISTFDGLWFRLFLSAGSGGDARFIDEIEAQIPSYRPAPRDELKQTAQSRLSLAPV